MALYVFLFLAFLSIFSAVMTVIARNPIHSVIYLIICFFSIAGHYLLLNAQFLAVVHVIVYAGAIMVLFLFTIMLMNLNEETEQHKPALAKIGAAIASMLLMLVLIAVLMRADKLPAPEAQTAAYGTIQNLGQILLNEYLFPFEFSSVLFLSAMVGAVLLSKREKALKES